MEENLSVIKQLGMVKPGDWPDDHAKLSPDCITACPICDQAGTISCPDCHGVMYCGEQHKKKDAKVHTMVCQAWQDDKEAVRPDGSVSGAIFGKAFLFDPVAETSRVVFLGQQHIGKAIFSADILSYFQPGVAVADFQALMEGVPGLFAHKLACIRSTSSLRAEIISKFDIRYPNIDEETNKKLWDAYGRFPINKTLNALVAPGKACPLRGTWILFAYSGHLRLGDFRLEDVTPRDARHLADYILNFGNNWSCVADPERHLDSAGNSMHRGHAVLVPCPADRKQSRKAFEEILVTPRAPLLQVVVLAHMMGMSWYVRQSATTEEIHRRVRAGEISLNEAENTFAPFFMLQYGWETDGTPYLVDASDMDGTDTLHRFTTFSVSAEMGLHLPMYQVRAFHFFAQNIWRELIKIEAKEWHSAKKNRIHLTGKVLVKLHEMLNFGNFSEFCGMHAAGLFGTQLAATQEPPLKSLDYPCRSPERYGVMKLMETLKWDPKLIHAPFIFSNDDFSKIMAQQEDSTPEPEQQEDPVSETEDNTEQTD